MAFSILVHWTLSSVLFPWLSLFLSRSKVASSHPSLFGIWLVSQAILSHQVWARHTSSNDDSLCASHTTSEYPMWCLQFGFHQITGHQLSSGTHQILKHFHQTRLNLCDSSINSWGIRAWYLLARGCSCAWFGFQLDSRISSFRFWLWSR